MTSDRTLVSPRVPRLSRQIVRFALVGGGSVLLQLALYSTARLWWGPLPSNLVALAVCTVVNTEANRRLTFEPTRRSHLRVQLEGFLVFVGYYSLTSGALLLLHHLVSDPPRWSELVVLVAASAIGTVARFLLLRSWVFRQEVG
ncbi:GtrA family protein [Angustibacter sp. McL0619]|uniref:GtrA family protein n=1 Tax=Angustibacter sp. McL0619 TaxID=3415676 RepID=UPI003CEA1B15